MAASLAKNGKKTPVEDDTEARRRKLRLHWRSELDMLPMAQLVVPSEEVARKPGAFYIETELVPRENVWELLRSAIDEALEKK